MAGPLKTLLDGLAFPEGPRWRDGELYFSDMHFHEVVAMTPSGARRTHYKHADAVSGLGWLPDGRMLVVSMIDRRVMRLEGGKAVLHADLSDIATGNVNDMVVDAHGRAYVGNFGFAFPRGEPKAAALARIDADGAVSVAAEGLMFPNGTVITPDGRTLIVGESMAGRLTAYTIGDDGALTDRRVWAELSGGAVPDGICLDAEGAVWVASPSTNNALRVREGGEIADQVDADRGVYACMLGGPDKRTLYLLTAKSTDPDECRALKSGRIEAVQVEAPGAGWP
jgi:sugar lactone lactonase YvrE